MPQIAWLISFAIFMLVCCIYRVAAFEETSNRTMQNWKNETGNVMNDDDGMGSVADLLRRKGIPSGAFPHLPRLPININSTLKNYPFDDNHRTSESTDGTDVTVVLEGTNETGVKKYDPDSPVQFGLSASEKLLVSLGIVVLISLSLFSCKIAMKCQREAAAEMDEEAAAAAAAEQPGVSNGPNTLPMRDLGV